MSDVFVKPKVSGHCFNGNMQFTSTIEGEYVVVELKTCENCGALFTRETNEPQCPRCISREEKRKVVHDFMIRNSRSHLRRHADLVNKAMEVLGGEIQLAGGGRSTLPEFVRSKDIYDGKARCARRKHSQKSEGISVHGAEAS